MVRCQRESKTSTVFFTGTLTSVQEDTARFRSVRSRVRYCLEALRAPTTAFHSWDAENKSVMQKADVASKSCVCRTWRLLVCTNMLERRIRNGGSLLNLSDW